MSFSVQFIERGEFFPGGGDDRDRPSPSIERVFRSIGDELKRKGVEVGYFKLPHHDTAGGIAKNFLVTPPEADILHICGQSTYYGLRMSPKRTVATFHDLNILRIRSGLRRKVIKQLFFNLPVRHLKYLTAISEATKRDLVACTGCDPERISVIGNPLTISSEPHIREFDVDRPRLLQIGALPHKNIVRLARALAGLRVHLIVVGGVDGVSMDALIKNGIDVEFHPVLSDQEILHQYRSADAVTFFSTIEGFGLPIIEAQAMGVPVLTSDVDPMRDVAGKGALLADPFSVSSMRTLIERVIADAEFRAAAVDAGRRNVQRFSPQAIAGKYLDFYEKMLQ